MGFFLRHDIFLAATSRYFFEKGKLPNFEEENLLFEAPRTFSGINTQGRVETLLAWFKRLKSEGATDVFLIPWKEWSEREPIPLGQPTALAIMKEPPAVWVAEWSFSEELERWKAVYREQNLIPELKAFSVPAAKRELDDTLRDLISFCRESSEEWPKYWEEKFSEALDDDRLADGFSNVDLEFGPIIFSGSGMLLKKVNKLCIFGGMGSWADNYLGGEEGKIKELLTRRLYLAVVIAACSAVNNWVFDKN